VGEAGAEAPKKKNLHRIQLHLPTSSRAPTVCPSPTTRRPTAHQSSSTIMSRSLSPPLPEIKSHHDIPCGHAVAVIQRFRPPAPSPQRNPRDYIPYNLTVAAMVATYSQSLPPIDVGALQAPPGDPALWECRPPLFKKAKGRPQTARLTAGEQRGRRAAWRGALPEVPDRVPQRCSRCRQEGHNILNCRALPDGL
jgi:hypothetical protein